MKQTHPVRAVRDWRATRELAGTRGPAMTVVAGRSVRGFAIWAATIVLSLAAVLGLLVSAVTGEYSGPMVAVEVALVHAAVVALVLADRLPLRAKVEWRVLGTLVRRYVWVQIPCQALTILLLAIGDDLGAHPWVTAVVAVVLAVAALGVAAVLSAGGEVES